VPVTGDVNPARISNQLDFSVWSQDGEQIGDVEDMVLDLDNTRVAYVVVGTGGFLDLGERTILVPWESLALQTGTGDTTGGQQNAFVLQTDVDTFSNTPDFDLGTLPEMGQAAGDWDVDIRNYWQGGGAGTANTPAAGDATATGEATVQATATVGTDQATAPAATAPATSEGQTLQGVVLASEVLGSSINWGAAGQGTGTGTDQGQATATAGTGDATATPESTATAEAGSAGTDQGNTSGTIEDMIVDTADGNILYIVVTAAFAEGERWIPVPLNQFQWNGTAGAFTLNVDASVLQTAPSFQNGQFPDTSAAGWNAEIDTFWQNNGGTGTP
jgi:sporulation protein YlmC with PRC-barrel domain